MVVTPPWEPQMWHLKPNVASGPEGGSTQHPSQRLGVRGEAMQVSGGQQEAGTQERAEVNSRP